ncbi:MAG: hypothetical protein ACO1Q7_08695 [Gemmatimonas sp.]
MLPYGAVTKTAISTIDVDEQRLRVTLHVSHDGVEYVGRLWFANTAWEDAGIPDRGIVPGRTEAEVLALARRLRPDELLQRYRRANAEKRRFHGLRQLTLELLSKVRYLNQVAVSMRSGLLDVDAAQQEIELTERQMIELVKQAKMLAGVES